MDYINSYVHAGVPSNGSTLEDGNFETSIMLPPSLFSNISDRDGVGVFFALYRETNLFPIREIESTADAVVNTTVGSFIASVTVGPGLVFRNLDPPLEINLVISEMNDSVSRTSIFYFIYTDVIYSHKNSLHDSTCLYLIMM